MTEPVERADVVIIGAGPVGMTLARAIADSPYRVLLIDHRPRGAWSADPRALALAHGSRQILETLGAWRASAATPIESIHVSQRDGFGRTLIEAADYAIPALGYVMRYRDLAAALDEQIGTGHLLDDSRVVDLNPGDDAVHLGVDCHGDVRRIDACLVVHAEGSPANDSSVSVCDYRQHAVISEVSPVATHRRRAWERFTADGPVALLPLGQDYSVVLTVRSERADELLACDEQGFLAVLRRQFGGRLDFSRCGPRAAFPLALRWRNQPTAQRQLWIGNAAQTLHPVSGQGLNLGLRDARGLAELLSSRPDADPGDHSLLASYARNRRFDRTGGVAFTDSIVRIFSNDLGPLRLARGAGLLALDLFPPLRHFVARRMIWGARAWP